MTRTFSLRRTVLSRRRRVAATPRPRRGYSVDESSSRRAELGRSGPSEYPRGTRGGAATHPRWRHRDKTSRPSPTPRQSADAGATRLRERPVCVADDPASQVQALLPPRPVRADVDRDGAHVLGQGAAGAEDREREEVAGGRRGGITMRVCCCLLGGSRGVVGRPRSRVPGKLGRRYLLLKKC